MRSRSESADFLYKAADFHASGYERCICRNDATLNITWPQLQTVPLMSAKGAKEPLKNYLRCYFCVKNRLKMLIYYV
ncbi:MAG: dTDP-4-dehydrorhamnose 3,5-epimerase family protein [Nitrosomonas sp. H1_AOB3]|nr:MAG: dTDP-4-dehydrorhamnose 3,5-epimerase family protein [Nitrosomonas sp. H1_AOB3]